MRRVDAALVGIAVVLAVVWYVLRVAPPAPEPAQAGTVTRSAGRPSPSPAGGPPSPSPGASEAPAARPVAVAAVEVVHKHKLGSCRGRLSVTAASLRYEPTRPGDGFDVPRAAVDRVEADARKRALFVKLRGGRTYNFTDAQGRPEPLVSFQKAFAKSPARPALVP
jgi:hypothetical protein